MAAGPHRPRDRGPGGALVDCKPPSENDVPAWIDRLAEDHKRQIDAEARAVLLERVGPELSQLDSELRKLAGASEERIDAKLVKQLVAKSSSDEVWALQEAVLSGIHETHRSGLARGLGHRSKINGSRLLVPD